MAQSKTRPDAPAASLSVLVAEDNPVMQKVIQFLLGAWGYDVIVTGDGSHAWEILQKDSAPRLALLDWMIPGVDGVELCRRIRAAGREPYTYILLVSARTDAADLVKAIDAGADDYLRKPFDTQELRARLNAGSRIVLLHQELLAAREELRRQAVRDSLTGTLNHRCILETLDRDLEFCGRANEPVAAVLIDIDRFSHINDSFGHPAGDEVLVEAARRLDAIRPPAASLGRYGGGQFLLVLPSCGRAAASAHAEQVREAISSAVFTAGAASFPVSCSIGVACSDGPVRCGATALLRELDESISRARREARIQSAAASPAPDPFALRSPASVRP